MSEQRASRSRSVRDVTVGAACAIGALVLLGSGPGQSSASAVPNLPNASAQRFAIIDALERLEERIKELESTLSEGELVVKVSELPEVTISEE